MTIRKEKGERKATAEKSRAQILYCQCSSYERTTGRVIYLKSAEFGKGKIQLHRVI